MISFDRAQFTLERAEDCGSIYVSCLYLGCKEQNGYRQDRICNLDKGWTWHLYLTELYMSYWFSLRVGNVFENIVVN